MSSTPETSTATRREISNLVSAASSGRAGASSDPLGVCIQAGEPPEPGSRLTGNRDKSGRTGKTLSGFFTDTETVPQ